jgi:putative methionine-R-sulfoxide reductase with GAF domain
MTEACSVQSSSLSTLLRQLLERVAADGGSLHHVHASNQYLTLTTTVGLPDSLLPHIEKIPARKGLAGLAWANKSVVSSCDLLGDPNVGSGARALPFNSTYAIPILNEDRVIAVLGVAFKETVDLTHEMHNHLSDLPDALRESC